MGSSDWFELETLSDEIAHSQTRLSAARKTQNHGLVKLLQREIAEAEKWRSRLLGHITTRLGSPEPVQQADHAAAWEVQAEKAEGEQQTSESEPQNTEPVGQIAEETGIAVADLAPYAA